MQRFWNIVATLVLAFVVTQAGAQTYSPYSTLILGSTTTAYGANKLVASSPTAALVQVPQIAPPTPIRGLLPRLRLSINDPTSTAWPNVQVQVDEWTCAPTFTNGDGGTWAVATGAGAGDPISGGGCHFASYTGTFSADVNADGVYVELSPTVATAPAMPSKGGLWWTLRTVTATGARSASTTTATLVQDVVQ